MSEAPTFTAFAGDRLLAAGQIEAIAAAACIQQAGGLQIFEDATGRPVELDLRHGPAAAVADFRARTGAPAPSGSRPARGRPRLGVTAREVTLLPRHWDWLAAQPGGASAALRRLVEEARRAGEGPERLRQAREAAYRVMSALGGDLPGFEEASRALFADDADKLMRETQGWPQDVRQYVLRLASAR
jgi:hypothetical protein